MELLNHVLSTATQKPYLGSYPAFSSTFDSTLNSSSSTLGSAVGFISVDLSSHDLVLPFVITSFIEDVTPVSVLSITQPSRTQNRVFTNLRDKLYAISANCESLPISVKDNALQAAHVFDSLNILGVSVCLTADNSIMFELYANGSYFSLEFFEDNDIVYLSRVGQDNAYAYDITAEDVYERICEVYEQTLSLHV